MVTGQELLTYESFDFPTPPKFDWGLVDSNAGMLREVKDLIALRSNTAGFSHGLVGGTFATLCVFCKGQSQTGILRLFRSGKVVEHFCGWRKQDWCGAPME